MSAIYYVYLIKSDKHTKIGVAKNPSARIKELQTGNQFELKMIATIPMQSQKEAYSLESFLHSYYSKHRSRGEWFLLNNIKIKKALDKYHSMGFASARVKRVEEVGQTIVRERIAKVNDKCNRLLIQRSRLASALKINGIHVDDRLLSDSVTINELNEI